MAVVTKLWWGKWTRLSADWQWTFSGYQQFKNQTWKKRLTTELAVCSKSIVSLSSYKSGWSWSNRANQNKSVLMMDDHSVSQSLALPHYGAIINVILWNCRIVSFKPKCNGLQLHFAAKSVQLFSNLHLELNENVAQMKRRFISNDFCVLLEKMYMGGCMYAVSTIAFSSCSLRSTFPPTLWLCCYCNV